MSSCALVFTLLSLLLLSGCILFLWALFGVKGELGGEHVHPALGKKQEKNVCEE